jgi:hypothetical protein
LQEALERRKNPCRRVAAATEHRPDETVRPSLSPFARTAEAANRRSPSPEPGKPVLPTASLNCSGRWSRLRNSMCMARPRK